MGNIFIAWYYSKILPIVCKHASCFKVTEVMRVLLSSSPLSAVLTSILFNFHLVSLLVVSEM